MAKIYYIHGLSGSAQSATCVGLRENFDGVECLAYPSETATFGENLRTITDAFYGFEGIFKSPEILVVGTSLGGFFASKLADEIARRGGVGRVKFLMINPAVSPYDAAKAQNYPRYLVDSYKGIKISDNKKFDRKVVLCLDDELLDPSPAAEIFGKDVITFPTGGHSCWNARKADILAVIGSMIG